ncbi:hypothetical protein V070_00209 [Staphylococcus aureus C0673]|nr:hypothetical protein V070_00209 [Staphylococcus aureus C0673]
MKAKEEQTVLDQVDIKRVEIEAVKNKDILDKVKEVLGR